MKKSILILFCCALAVVAQAQNLQVHYDFGRKICQDLRNGERTPHSSSCPWDYRDRREKLLESHHC